MVKNIFDYYLFQLVITNSVLIKGIFKISGSEVSSELQLGKALPPIYVNLVSRSHR